MARALIVAILIVAAHASTVLRRGALSQPETTPLPGDPEVHETYDYAPLANPDTTSKYTEAESVEQVLFVMACKAKHKNDIDGSTRDAAKDGNFDEQGFQDYMKGLQKANIAEMKETCGHVNAKHAKECHAGCTAKWAQGASSFSLPAEKTKCVQACELKHKNWGEECLEQVANLENVYIQEQGNLANTKKCQELHCPLFPAVLMAKEPEDKEIKKKGCQDECTDKGIAAKCKKRWDLNLDFSMAGYQSECQGDAKSNTLEPCMADGTKEVDGEHDTCKSDGHAGCDDKHQACLDEGQKAGADSMVGANSESICGTRQDNCKELTNAKCMKKHKQALDKLQKTCKKNYNDKLHKCMEKKLKEGRKAFHEDCVKEVKPICEEECDGDCNIPDMRECQNDMLKKAFGVTNNYCTQLWDWLFSSEQYDPKTMDVIPKATGGGRFKLNPPKRLR